MTLLLLLHPLHRSVVVGVSIERLTHDRYKWRGEDIANINTVAQRSVRQTVSKSFRRMLSKQSVWLTPQQTHHAYTPFMASVSPPHKCHMFMFICMCVHALCLPRRPWALKLLANSLAPSIYGHDTIKEGMVLMLMGGMERVVGNMHIRCVCCGWGGVGGSKGWDICVAEVTGWQKACALQGLFLPWQEVMPPLLATACAVGAVLSVKA